jgi:hypothetical protein
LICRLVNRSGLRLSYWVETEAGQSDSFSLPSWEETPLMVEPVEKSVLMADSQQHVPARTICMQFEVRQTL